MVNHHPDADRRTVLQSLGVGALGIVGLSSVSNTAAATTDGDVTDIVVRETMLDPGQSTYVILDVADGTEPEIETCANFVPDLDSFADCESVKVYQQSTVEISFKQPGEYTVFGYAVDDGVTTGWGMHHVVVIEDGEPFARPQARLDAPDTASVGEEIVLDGSESHFERGEIRFYWTIDGQIIQNGGPRRTVAFDEPGEKEIELSVHGTIPEASSRYQNDIRGYSEPIEHTIQVTDTADPTASFSWSPRTPGSGESVKLDASESDGDGESIVEYTWEIDPPIYNPVTLTGQRTHFPAFVPGMWTITLTIETESGATDDDSQGFRVVDDGIVRPTSG